MKRFLTVSGPVDGFLTLSVGHVSTERLFEPGGHTSPIFPAIPDGTPAALDDSGVVALIVPSNASELLARLTDDLGSTIRDSTYISHGHASVILLLPDMATWRRVQSEVNESVRGFEVWPYADGVLAEADIEFLRPPSVDVDPPAYVSTSGIGSEATAQIEQFNANVTLLARCVASYAPEIGPAVEWLCESVAEVANELRAIDASDLSDDAAIRRSIMLETVLVEVNAVTTLYTSQLGSGAVPLHHLNFPVGEYSLLGIGSMVRSIWRLYHHLAQTFGEFDHVGRIQRSYRSRPPFDVFTPSGRINYGSWVDSPSAIPKTEDDTRDQPRLHLPYFSSRWGFHESLHSVSVSWQCLHASATKEWNLLTITHEFLHSHVRELLACFMNVNHGGGEVHAVLTRYNERNNGNNAFESFQCAIVEALVGLRGAAILAARITGIPDERRLGSLPKNLNEASLKDLVRTHGGLLHEVMVHVLDFLYVYDGRDAEYINSVWSSWSMVPSVNDRIEHYTLRTLCTLASTSIHDDPDRIFRDVVDRAVLHLTPLMDRERGRPAIRAAVDLLGSDLSLKKLDVEFRAARFIAKLTRHLMYDGELNANLVRDELTTVAHGRRTYSIAVGSYLGEHISSPIGFILDRFGDYDDQAGTDVAEYESIWQMLQLI